KPMNSVAARQAAPSHPAAKPLVKKFDSYGYKCCVKRNLEALAFKQPFSATFFVSLDSVSQPE
ncbi:MAG TPA: hypothetical protein VFR80_17045, partial [Pyrinomonadaceae bacterium]|nr:hypothetical protein [Pyrinomonadaceae bacterium]